MKPKTIVFLVLVAFVAVVLLQNMHKEEVRLLFWGVQMPLFLLILSTLILGWIAGWFTHVAYSRGKAKGDKQSRQAAVIEQTNPKQDPGNA